MATHGKSRSGDRRGVIKAGIALLSIYFAMYWAITGAVHLVSAENAAAAMAPLAKFDTVNCPAVDAVSAASYGLGRVPDSTGESSDCSSTAAIDR